MATSTERLAVRRDVYATQVVEICEQLSRGLGEPVAAGAGER
jgi:hypothetical protein